MPILFSSINWCIDDAAAHITAVPGGSPFGHELLLQSHAEFVTVDAGRELVENGFLGTKVRFHTGGWNPDSNLTIKRTWDRIKLTNVTRGQARSRAWQFV